MQTRHALERKGILVFLIITFAITYAIEGALIASGFRFSALPGPLGQGVVFAVMWVPALSTLITVKFITHEKPALANFRVGSYKPYLASALILPVCFAIAYGITWALGLAQPDWNLDHFRGLFLAAGVDVPEIPNPVLALLGIFAVSALVGPFFNGLVALGEEIGWRGYLLPRLMPLGKPRAYVLVGVIWGLWHLPLVVIGFTYPNEPILGPFAFIAMTTALSIYVNELTLQNNSCLLAAWVHGIFNSQKLGLWSLLFPTFNPLIGGYAGLIGIIVWLALGWWQMREGTGHRVPAARVAEIPQ